MSDDRDSFYSLKRVASSKRFQVFGGTVLAVLTAAYGWIKGFDDAFAKIVDVRELEKKVETLDKQKASLETAIGEIHAELIAAEQRIAEIEKRERIERQAAAKEAEEAEKAEYEYWRAIVMSNAPKGRDDAYARAYKANYEDGHRPMAAAHMTLGWGSAGR